MKAQNPGAPVSQTAHSTLRRSLVLSAAALSLAVAHAATAQAAGYPERSIELVVPFAAGAETEQSLRATLLAEQGRLAVVEETGLTPQSLADGITRALALPPSPPLPLRLDGAKESAAVLIALAQRREAH